MDTHRFVGRRAELETIERTLADRTEHARLITVNGPAGIGKTSLVEAGLRGFTGPTIWTRCWNGPGTPSLWPWRQALRHLGADGATADVDDVGESGAASSADTRFAQFDRICDVIADTSRRDAVVIVIDDIHWADPASLDLLRFIARDRRRSRVRLIATMRDGESPTVEHQRLVAALEREATLIQLGGLPDRAIGEIALGLGVTDDRVVDSVIDRSGGNPFFATELLNQIGTSPDPDSPIPASIRSLIESQLELMDDAGRRLLRHAAVQGQVFRPELAGAAAAIPRHELERALATARRLRLVTQRGDGWAFGHALVGEALVSGLEPLELAQHHLATADSLEGHRLGEDDLDRAESIANHLWASRSIAPATRLFDTFSRTAARARAAAAFETDATMLARAVEIGDGSDEVGADAVIDALIDRCTAEKSLGRSESARSTALDAAARARSIGDPSRFARVALVFPPDAEGVELDQVHDPDQAALLEQAIADLPDDQPLLRAQLQASLAISLYWAAPVSDTERRHELARRRDTLTADALSIAEESGDDRTLAVALRAKLYANWGPDTEADRLGLALRIIDVATRLGDRRLGLEGRIWRISDHLTHGRLVEASAELDHFEAEATTIRDRYQRWSALRVRANIAFMSGDLETAQRVGRDAFKFGSTFLPGDAALHFYSAALGPLTFLSGSMGDTVDFVRGVVEDSPHVPAWRLGYALGSVEAGDLERARSELEAVAAEGFAMIPRDLDFLTSLATAATVVRATGQREIAHALADELRPFAGRLIVHGIGYASYGSFHLSLGECADGAGDREQAEHHYLHAIEELDRIGSLHRAHARRCLGELLAGDRPRRARSLLTAAIEQFEAAGASRAAGQTQAILDDLEQRRIARLHDDDGWRLERSGRATITLPDLRGFRALVELLTHPNESRHALVLASIIEGHGITTTPSAETEIADEQAITAYRARVTVLQDQLDAADRTGDVATSERLQAELDAVADELTRSIGLGGRRATTTGAAGRARVNVTKHLKRAIERIADADPVLGDELRTAIATGMHCVYQPSPDGTTWSR